MKRISPDFFIKNGQKAAELLLNTVPVLMLLLLAAFITACDDQTEEPDDRLLFWHSLGGKDGALMDLLLDRYEDLHPGVTIVREQIPSDEIAALYKQRVNEGLGPDMMLITDYRLASLLAEGLVRDLSDHDIDLSDIDPVAQNQALYQGQLVGLPFSTFTQVLCYNREQIAEAPATLDALMADIESGHLLGHHASFTELAWTMSALGGSFFGDLNRVELNEEELIRWFEWLDQANEQPNIIINVDMDQLAEAFVAAELDYLVCPTERIPALLDVLGHETLGIAALPSQSGGLASAYAITDIIVFNPAADPGSVAQGVNVAQFLTDPAQQTTLALETQSQVPVNVEVDIDSRLAPMEATLLAQPKSAAPLDFIAFELLSLEVAEPILDRVLAGELKPEPAASELTRLVSNLSRDLE